MMIREPLLGILLFCIRLMVASGDSVLQYKNITIEGKVGKTVIFPCLVEMNITHERVEWFKGEKTSENDQPIHKCIWRPNATQIQREDFKNLTSLFEEELSSGIFSLSLKVNPSHNGTYYCYVGGRLYCTVTIKVLPEEDDTSQMNREVTVSPDKPLNGPTQNNWTIVGIVGAVVGLLVVVALIAFGVYLYRKRRNPFCCRRNANNPQTHPSVLCQIQQPPQDEGNERADQNPEEERIQMIENEDQGDPADGNEPAAGN